MRVGNSVSSPALPGRVTARVLGKLMRPGEPVVVLVARGIGTTLPYEFRDREGRCFLMKWESRLDGHVLRVPGHVWMAGRGPDGGGDAEPTEDAVRDGGDGGVGRGRMTEGE